MDYPNVHKQDTTTLYGRHIADKAPTALPLRWLPGQYIWIE